MVAVRLGVGFATSLAAMAACLASADMLVVFLALGTELVTPWLVSCPALA